MNLKEYYKEILNTLLAEVTGAPEPVEPGSLRAKRLAGLGREFDRISRSGGSHYRLNRIADTMRAKGSNVAGDLNLDGLAARQAAAKKSNEWRAAHQAFERSSPYRRRGNAYDRPRKDVEKQKRANAARFIERSIPGNDK
jgi:hypothetical protein